MGRSSSTLKGWTSTIAKQSPSGHEWGNDEKKRIKWAELNSVTQKCVRGWESDVSIGDETRSNMWPIH